MKNAFFLSLLLLPTLAFAKCLYSPVALSPADLYALMNANLQNHHITLNASPFFTDKRTCRIELSPPDANGAMVLTVSEIKRDGKTVLRNAALELTPANPATSRAQCLWAKNGDPVKGPVSDITAFGKDGKLEAHLALDEPGAPFVRVEARGEIFSCASY